MADQAGMRALDESVAALADDPGAAGSVRPGQLPEAARRWLPGLIWGWGRRDRRCAGWPRPAGTRV